MNDNFFNVIGNQHLHSKQTIKTLLSNGLGTADNT